MNCSVLYEKRLHLRESEIETCRAGELQTRFSRLVVSVSCPHEADSAIRGGADLIDIKDPTRGSLGAASPHVWEGVVGEIAGRKPYSMALGELTEIESTFSFGSLAGAQFAKVGLADSLELPNWKSKLSWVREQLPSGTRLVAVVYGDWQRGRTPSPTAILKFAHRNRCSGILFDTVQKDGSTLFDHLSQAEIKPLLSEANAKKLFTCLAGSLTLTTLPLALALDPDYVAVRGAACLAGDRQGSVDASCVRKISNLVANGHVR